MLMMPQFSPNVWTIILKSSIFIDYLTDYFCYSEEQIFTRRGRINHLFYRFIYGFFFPRFSVHLPTLSFDCNLMMVFFWFLVFGFWFGAIPEIIDGVYIYILFFVQYNISVLLKGISSHLRVCLNTQLKLKKSWKPMSMYLVQQNSEKKKELQFNLIGFGGANNCN